MRDDARGAIRVEPGDGEAVEVQVMGSGFLDIFDARDISVTGVGIFVPYAFKGCNVNEPVDLVITLPKRRPFLAKGMVVHRTKIDSEFFGISFIGLSDESQAKVASYIDRRLREEGEQPP